MTILKTTTLTALTLSLAACSSFMQSNIAGTYQGTLPCADCEKIEAELVLNADNTYQYNTVYFKNGQEFPFTEKGAFTRNTAQGTIVLTNSNNLTLKVDNNHAELCDANGNVAKSSNNYKLTKISAQ